MLEVRRARPDEFDAVLAFYAQMIDEMHGTDFDVLWKHDEHPSPAFLRESLDAGQMFAGFLTEDGAERIAAALVMNGEGAPGYERVPWRVDAAPEETGVLHVVATLPLFHGRGFARRLVQSVVSTARAEGKRAVRLDSFVWNVRGRGLYESCGFVHVGDFPVFYDDLGTVNVAMYELAL